MNVQPGMMAKVVEGDGLGTVVYVAGEDEHSLLWSRHMGEQFWDCELLTPGAPVTSADGSRRYARSGESVTILDRALRPIHNPDAEIETTRETEIGVPA